MLDATVGYARVREQFGRPIGSFQAVKHACADMLVQVAVSRELVAEAVERRRPASGRRATTPTRQRGRVDGQVVRRCHAAVDVAGKAMQLHGGIGYTWESGIHVYLKRAALNRSLFGSPGAHRRQTRPPLRLVLPPPVRPGAVPARARRSAAPGTARRPGTGTGCLASSQPRLRPGPPHVPELAFVVESPDRADPLGHRRAEEPGDVGRQRLVPSRENDQRGVTYLS